MSDSEVEFCSNRYCIWPRLLFCDDAQDNSDKCPTFDKQSSRETSERCGIISGTAIRGMLLHYVSNQLKRPVVIMQRPEEPVVGNAGKNPSYCARKALPFMSTTTVPAQSCEKKMTGMAANFAINKMPRRVTGCWITSMNTQKKKKKRSKKKIKLLFSLI